MHMRTHCKKTQNHRSIRSTREDRRQINRMAHQIPEDEDGVEDPDCADVPNVHPETVTATSAI